MALSVFLLTQGIFALCFVMASDGEYANFVARWDGVQYSRIARDGYPIGDPTDPVWAFYPLYPSLVKLFSLATTISPSISAPIVSVLAAAAAVVCLFHLLERSLDRASAIVVVALLCTWMAAPVMQMDYTESLALLLLVLATDLLLRRNYAGLMLVLVFLSLCRPILIPFAFMGAGHGLVLLRRGVTDARWLTPILVSVCVALAGVWPVTAGYLSGEPNVYLNAMASWAAPGEPRSWAAMAINYGAPGWILMAILTLTLVWAAARLVPRAFPVELRAWMVAYPLYIAIATYMSGSIVRYLIFGFPAAVMFSPLASKGPKGIFVLGIMGIAGFALGIYWITHFVGGDAGPIP
ncbi:hypothetical protein [Humibacillus xanthopallidus]|nr:hypothetical protein [Humibacillus xanthopallidus]